MGPGKKPLPIAPPFFWLVQALILGIWGLAWFLAPGTSLSLLTGQPVAGLASEAVDQLRMSSPYLMGLAGFSVFAAMTRRTRMRRGFGLVFGIALTLWSIANWVGIASGLYGTTAVLLAIVPSALALANVAVALPTPPGWAPAENAGTSSTKPPAAFVIWLIQGSVLLSGATAFYFTPAMTLGLITGQSAAGLSPVAVHQTQLLGALSSGIALFSFFAVRSQRSFAWRGFAFFFVVFMSIWTVSIAWILGQGSYAWPVLSVLVPGLLFLPMNVWLGRQHGEFDPGDVNRHSEVWTARDLIAGPLMALAVFLTRRRSSHGLGVGARGTFRPSSREGVPANDFFDSGSHPVQVRFANLTQLDDAALDVRGCAIKFSDEAYESPLDLLMNTGSFCPSTNLVTFASFVASKVLPASTSEAALRKNLPAREGGVAGLRRAPGSYSSLHYYAQIVRFWTEPGSDRHLVRYRCIADEGDEEGLPSAEDASHIWLRGRLPSETRRTDYLRNELRERLAREPVRMRLQAQFHTPTENESKEWYNPAVDWDQRTNPWHDLGTIELTEALSEEETEYLQFDPGNHPESLGIPRSDSPLDYRSMGDSEARVVHALQHLRLWTYRTFGLPPFGEVSGR